MHQVYILGREYINKLLHFKPIKLEMDWHVQIGLISALQALSSSGPTVEKSSLERGWEGTT